MHVILCVRKMSGYASSVWHACNCSAQKHVLQVVVGKIYANMYTICTSGWGAKEPVDVIFPRDIDAQMRSR